jgi:hypothetical protein
MSDPVISFVVTAPGQEPVTAEIPWDVAELWMQSLGITTIRDAVTFVAAPIIRQGNALKAEVDSADQIANIG